MRGAKFWLLVLIALLVVVSLGAMRYVFRTNQAPVVADTAAVTTLETSLPKNASKNPWGITTDSQGHIWVAIPGCDPNPRCKDNTPEGKIVEYDPDTQKWLGIYTLPAGYGQALFLKFDQKGRLWFPLFMSNSLGMFDPARKTFNRWEVPSKKSGPWDVAIDRRGNVWFTEHYINKIARFNPTTATFQEITIPALKSYPYGIVIDSADNVWFTENNRAVALIGEYTAKGQLLEYKPYVPGHDKITPHLITVDRNNNIWWSEGISGRIGRLEVARAQPGTSNGVSEYIYEKPCKACGVHTSGIAADSAGRIWFDDSLQGILGFMSDTGKGPIKVFNTLTPFSHPHDGLITDAKNRVWFTAQYTGQLGVVLRSNSLS